MLSANRLRCVCIYRTEWWIGLFPPRSRQTRMWRGGGRPADQTQGGREAEMKEKWEGGWAPDVTSATTTPQGPSGHGNVARLRPVPSPHALTGPSTGLRPEVWIHFKYEIKNIDAYVQLISRLLHSQTMNYKSLLCVKRLKSPPLFSSHCVFLYWKFHHSHTITLVTYEYSSWRIIYDFLTTNYSGNTVSCFNKKKNNCHLLKAHL